MLQPRRCRAAFPSRVLLSAAERCISSFVAPPAPSAASAPEIPLSVASYAVWGANTDVGKTLVCAGLAHVSVLAQVPFSYVKPVQTGYPLDSDARLVAAACGTSELAGPHAEHLLMPATAQANPAAMAAAPGPHVGAGTCPPPHVKVLHAWSAAVGPHLASTLEGRPVSDAAVVHATAAELSAFAAGVGRRRRPQQPHSMLPLALVETAGGVASPAPSGRLQCDVLRPLRLPCLLVGDGRLGGISTTISAYESLVSRGFDVPVIVIVAPHDAPAASAPPVGPPMPSGASAAGGGALTPMAAAAAIASTSGSPALDNAAALARHFSAMVSHPGGTAPVVHSLPSCAPRPASVMTGTLASSASSAGQPDAALAAWLLASRAPLSELLALLQRRHVARVAALRTAAEQASSTLWWPFTQHATLRDGAVQVLDARVGEHWHVYRPPAADAAAAQAAAAAGLPPAGGALADAAATATPGGGGDGGPAGHSSSVEQGAASPPAQPLPASAASASAAVAPGGQAAEGGGGGTALEVAGSLVPLYDACGSWWTQGLCAELQPQVVSAVSAATARYMHVMFPEVAHQPALAAAEALLDGVGRGWASRVFFSDNGSTAIEIALKMAFRKYLLDHGHLENTGAGAPPLAAAEAAASGAMASPPPVLSRPSLTAAAAAAAGAVPPAGGSRSKRREALELQVLGLQNAYHGDTLGAMDCVAPSVFNSALQAPWYSGGRGLFLHPPYVAMKDGSWHVVQPPPWLHTWGAAAGVGRGCHAALAAVIDVTEGEGWDSLEEMCDPSRDGDALARLYRRFIAAELDAFEEAAAAEANAARAAATVARRRAGLDDEGPEVEDDGVRRRVLAACMIEPVVQGAGGMLLVDPLFQKVVVQACRERRIPVVFDEVFSGLYRLGALSAGAQLLREAPDIACYGKLMTAGTVAMAATLATEAVFNAFGGTSKLHSLLHGHSYTAYPAGCAATAAALSLLSSPTANSNLCAPRPAATRSSSGPAATAAVSHQGQAGTGSRCRKEAEGGKACAAACGQLLPLWDDKAVRALSGHALVSHLVAVGTLVAVTLHRPLQDAPAGAAASTSAGVAYGGGSGVAADVVRRLREEHRVAARPLGDVVYLMVTPTTRPDVCAALLAKLHAALDGCLADPAGPGASGGDGCVV